MPRVKKSDVPIAADLDDGLPVVALKKSKIPKIKQSEPEPEMQPVEIHEKVKKIRVKKTPSKMIDSSGSDNSNEETATTTDKKNNKWLEHIRSYRQANPDVSYKEALKLAKESYSR